MPMNGCPFREAVVHNNVQPVTFLHANLRARKFPVVNPRPIRMSWRDVDFCNFGCNAQIACWSGLFKDTAVMSCPSRSVMSLPITSATCQRQQQI
jgi:hypothetical protein